MPSSRQQLLPFGALSASYFAHIGFFNPYLPLWLKELGYGLLTISLLTAVQSATRLFAPYVWGWLSDHTGERVRLLRLSASVALLTSVLLWWPVSPLWLGVVLFIMFTHTSSMMPMAEAAMAHLVSRDGHFDARLYGRVRLCGSVGFLITVFVAGTSLEMLGMQMFPFFTVLSLALVLACVWVLPDQRKDTPAHAAHSLRTSVVDVLRQSVVRWFFASVFFHVLSHIGVYLFLSLYLDALGYSKTMIGLLWAVSVVAEIVWFYFQARWLPLLTLLQWLVACAALMTVRTTMVAAWGAWLPVLMAAQLLHALTFAAHHTVCIAFITQYFPGRLGGRGQALYTVVAYGFPGVLGALLGGLVSEHFGLSSVYWASALASLLALAGAWHLRRLAPVAARAP